MTQHKSNAKLIGTVNPCPLTEKELMPKDPFKEVENAMLGSYKRGKESGMLDAEVTLLKIINGQADISANDLVNQFLYEMKTKREKL